jgi:hypothetical protein
VVILQSRQVLCGRNAGFFQQWGGVHTYSNHCALNNSFSNKSCRIIAVYLSPTFAISHQICHVTIWSFMCRNDPFVFAVHSFVNQLNERCTKNISKPRLKSYVLCQVANTYLYFAVGFHLTTFLLLHVRWQKIQETWQLS